MGGPGEGSQLNWLTQTVSGNEHRFRRNMRKSFYLVLQVCYTLNPQSYKHDRNILCCRYHSFQAHLGRLPCHTSRISTQPAPLQNGQPFPPQILQEISISGRRGSVNGEIRSAQADFVSALNISSAKNSNACFKSAKETFFVHIQGFLPDGRNSVCAILEIASLRYTRPGQIIRIRRLLILHDTCLYGRSVCTKRYVRIMLDKESILHVAGRVVFCKVQRRECMPVVFDGRSFSKS